jgi:hypothetical protein
MVLKLSLSPEAEANLRQRAEFAGVDPETFATRELERIVARPTLDEVLAPLRAEVEASGMSEEELSDLLEEAKHEMRAK